MKVYFGVNGMGLGHAARMLIIANALSKLGHSSVFSSYGDAVRVIRKRGHKVYESPSLLWSEDKAGTVDPRGTMANSPLYMQRLLTHMFNEVDFIRKETPDVVVSDSRVSTILAAVLLGKRVITIVHQIKLLLPDLTVDGDQNVQRKIEIFASKLLDAFWARGEKILVPDFEPPLTLARSHLQISNDLKRKIVFIGPFISKKPHEYPSPESILKHLGIRARKVVYAGISGTPRERQALFRKIVHVSRYLPKDVFLLITQGEPSSSVIIRKENLHIYSWVKDRLMLLKACDLLITRGGHNTVSEAIYFGRPMLIIPTPNHPEHMEIARNAHRMGVAEVMSQSKSAREIASVILQLLENDILIENALRVSMVVKRYDATKKSVDIILDCM